LVGVIVEVVAVPQHLEDRVGAVHWSNSSKVDHCEGLLLAGELQEVLHPCLLPAHVLGWVALDALVVLEDEILPEEHHRAL